MLSTGEKIQKLRKERKMTQDRLGELLGVQKSAVAKYEKGRVVNLKRDTINRLAEIFNVSPNYLLGIDEPTVNLANNITVPLYDDVSCGTGLFVADNVEEYLSIPDTLLNPNKDYFCQYVNGDSMINESIHPGDLVIFEKKNTLNNGDIGCFSLEDNVATCKKYYLDNNNNCIILQPANNKYSPIVINEDNAQEFKIIGKLSLVISKR